MRLPLSLKILLGTPHSQMLGLYSALDSGALNSWAKHALHNRVQLRGGGRQDTHVLRCLTWPWR